MAGSLEEVSALLGLEQVEISLTALQMASKERAARFLSCALSFEKAISIGLRSGE
jgi:hypothetical protein